jgi:hypothetical protein
VPSLYHTFNLGLDLSTTLSGRVSFVVSLSTSFRFRRWRQGCWQFSLEPVISFLHFKIRNIQSHNVYHGEATMRE